jgi:hypothetical protein
MKKGIVNRNCTSSANKFYYLFIIFLVQSFAFGGKLVSSGNHYSGNFAGTTLCADESELYGVRCCSDTYIEGYQGVNSCAVWVESQFTTTAAYDPDVHQSGCVMEATYSEAVAICEAEGAELCSVNWAEGISSENGAGCTGGTGCGLDQELIWTSDDCGSSCADVNACNYDGEQESLYYVSENCDYGCDCVYSSDQAEECDPNAGYSAGYDDGVASVTPDDGIGQSDVDVAYAAGIASVTPEDGINQATVDAAVAIEFAAAYILGAQSGDINNSGFLNVSDIIMYIEKIVSE